MALLSLKEVSVGYGGRYLLEGVNLQIERGERVCLRGRNGAGKSTLMKLINGELPPDEGELVVQPGMRVGRLIQEVPLGRTGTVFEEIARGLGPRGEFLSRARQLNEQLTPENEAELRHELAEVQQELGADAGWELQQQVERVIDRLSLDGSMTFATLSSGLKRRVLLGQALVTEPDVLLLDEPTNHLDIEAIGWLEEFLLRYEGTLVFVTHDRMFLERLATRIIEIDRARLFDWTCDYKTFLVRKEAALDAEEKQRAVFDQKLAQEEVWIRQGIKARRTRNEGRVRALERLRAERADRREKVGNVKIQAQDVARSGSIVIKAQNISQAYDGKQVIRDFSTTIMRGDRLGIIGPNGAGKTTLLRILLEQMPPQTGTVKHGTQLEIAYFDQLRAQLNEEKSAKENVADGNDEVLINGQSRHVIGYLNDFLFSADRARSLVRYLSGGERNRLLLAKLFTKPANLLVLDEPTNDLDAETLELLEELLQDFPGTVLIVSHDRAFLNNVVTSTLVFEGDGVVKEYAGGYDDWVRARPAKVAEKPAEKTESPPPARPTRERARKLSFKDQRELEALPQTIESLETEQQELNTLLADPTFYQQDGTTIASTHARLETLQKELAQAYERWETLEELRE